jgi:hypothetical protein
MKKRTQNHSSLSILRPYITELVRSRIDCGEGVPAGIH